MSTEAVSTPLSAAPLPVGAGAKAQAATRAVAAWLITCAAMVFAMAIIGAITRLTESGLSITEWKPITGAIPPLNEAQWMVEFEKYRQIPEYQYVNRGMSLEEFKFIYFWEWFHRLWGRLIGVVFLVPFVWFWATGRLTPLLKKRGIGLLLLGGAQGFMGWFMVMSGLTERTDVSHYRLAAHLSLAFVIFAALLWVAFDTLDPRPKGHRVPAAAALRRHLWWSLALVSVTVVWGAFVAGLDAGFAYNTWPLMDGVLAPAEMWNLSPLALNFVENTATVQFTHRWLAILTAMVIWAYAWRALASGIDGRGRTLAQTLAAAITVQVILGISTLLSFVWIPVAAAHQGGALVVIALIIWALHELKVPRDGHALTATGAKGDRC